MSDAGLTWEAGRKGNAQVGFSAAELVRSFITILRPPAVDGQQHETGVPRVLYGSPVDGQGRSTARVFYQVLQDPEGSGAWIYSYNLYYGYNGCGNGIFTTRADSDEPHTLEYVSCPHSVHEADWERVAVVVCPDYDGGTAVAALLSQHNHHQLLDCRTSGECMWAKGDDDKDHLVVYSALHSHANLPGPSNGTVFGQVVNGQDGVFFVDRAADGGPVFMPTTDNILPLPGTVPGVESSQDDWAWSLYPGWWGAAEWRLPGPSLRCFSEDRTEFAPCPDNVAWRLAAAQAGIPAAHRMPPPRESVVFRPFLHLPTDPEASIPFDYHKAGGAKQGPRYRPWAHHWDGPKPLPLYVLPEQNAAYRVLLNSGHPTPHLECPTPGSAFDHSAPANFAATANLWTAVSLLWAVPLTLVTVAALRLALQQGLGAGGLCKPAPAPGTRAWLLRAYSHVPRSDPGPWSAEVPPPLSGVTASSNRQRSPTVGDAAEVELMAPLHNNGHGSGAASAGNSGPADLPFRRAHPPVSSGGGAHPSGCLAAVAIAAHNAWQYMQWYRAPLAAGTATCVACVVYNIGLWRAMSVIKLTLGILGPVLAVVRGLLTTLSTLLAATDLVLLYWPWAVGPAGASAREEEVPVLQSQLERWTDADEERDAEVAVHSIRPVLGATGARAHGSKLRRWFAVRTGLVYAGKAACWVLLAVAVVLVAAQAVSQVVCQGLVFEAFAHSTRGTGTNSTAAPALAMGAAAVIRPVGAVSASETAARLFASAVCVRWRDEYGSTLLVVGGLCWAVIRICSQSHRSLHV